MSLCDHTRIKAWRTNPPVPDNHREFVAGPGIERLDLCFDIAVLREALQICLSRTGFLEDANLAGFGALPLTRRPGQLHHDGNDLSGRYWMQPDSDHEEQPFEDLVDETSFSEFEPAFADTYFADVHQQLGEYVPIGRMRILSKASYSCNSWHRDPEPRLHIPIHTNPGALFIVGQHVTSLPADGSVYFTDTRAYHMGINGSLHPRVHLVAAIAW